MKLRISRMKHRRLGSSRTWIGALAAVTVVAGCSQRRPERIPTTPVRGTLLVNGQPAARANVYFHPRQAIAGANPLPFAIVEADGTFRPTTFVRHDGLPAGQYRVTVVWRRIVEYDGQEIASDDQFGGKYADPTQPVLTVDITDEPNELPRIELTL